MNISEQLRTSANKYAIMNYKPDPLDGLSKPAAKNYVNKLLSKYTKGMFSDEYWNGVENIWKALHDENVDFTVSKSDYHHDEKGVPTSKTWKFQMFLNLVE